MPMHFKFRLSDREFASLLKLNRAWVPARWKIFLLIDACMAPSLAIFYFLESGLSLLWFGTMMVVLLVYALMAYVKKTGFVEPYDQEFVFSETELHNTFSHSKAQLKWGLIDDVEESAGSFRIKRLGRFWLIPKRAMGERVEECAEFFSRVKGQALSDKPVQLYTECLETDDFPVYRFQYHSDDLKRACTSKFQLAGQHAVKPDRQPGGVSFRVLIALTLVALALLGLLNLAPDHRQLWRVLLLVATWTLPVFVMYAFVQLVRVFNRSRQGEVPPDVCLLKLLPVGWVIGNLHGVVLFDWRDVSEIYVSPEFFGFKTINQLLNLIPRRIFSDQAEADKFLALAIDFHGQSRNRSEVTIAQTVETGNPYQTPGA